MIINEHFPLSIHLPVWNIWTSGKDVESSIGSIFVLNFR